MESRGLGIGPGNPITNLFPLTNDDYGIRQFLYPQIIPEPSGLLVLIGMTGTLLLGRRRGRSSK